MSTRISKVNYYYVAVQDRPGEAYKLLSILAELGVNLLAFAAVPVGPMKTQLTLFPEDGGQLESMAQKSGMELDGPHPAILVQGDDELGAFASVHEKLYQADVNVFASSGVTDGRCCFGYVLYIRPEHFERAARALEI